MLCSVKPDLSYIRFLLVHLYVPMGHAPCDEFYVCVCVRGVRDCAAYTIFPTGHLFERVAHEHAH